jgi:hypothetical protein
MSAAEEFAHLVGGRLQLKGGPPAAGSAGDKDKKKKKKKRKKEKCAFPRRCAAGAVVAGAWLSSALRARHRHGDDERPAESDPKRARTESSESPAPAAAEAAPAADEAAAAVSDTRTKAERQFEEAFRKKVGVRVCVAQRV